MHAIIGGHPTRLLLAATVALALIATVAAGCAAPAQQSASWPTLDSGKAAFYYFGASS